MLTPECVSVVFLFITFFFCSHSTSTHQIFGMNKNEFIHINIYAIASKIKIFLDERAAETESLNIYQVIFVFSIPKNQLEN